MEEDVMKLLNDAHGALSNAMKLTESDFVRKKLKKLIAAVEECQFGLNQKKWAEYEVVENECGRYRC